MGRASSFLGVGKIYPGSQKEALVGNNTGWFFLLFLFCLKKLPQWRLGAGRGVVVSHQQENYQEIVLQRRVVPLLCSTPPVPRGP